MSMAGILGDHKGSVARDVLITMEEWQRMKALEEAAESGEAGEADEADETGQAVTVPPEDDEELEAIG